MLDHQQNHYGCRNRYRRVRRHIVKDRPVSGDEQAYCRKEYQTVSQSSGLWFHDPNPLLAMTTLKISLRRSRAQIASL